jgi:hypothetical protein
MREVEHLSNKDNSLLKKAIVQTMLNPQANAKNPQLHPAPKINLNIPNKITLPNLVVYTTKRS